MPMTPDLRAHSRSWEGPTGSQQATATICRTTIEPLPLDRGESGAGMPGGLFPADCLAMPGRHNLQNLMLATAVA